MVRSQSWLSGRWSGWHTGAALGLVLAGFPDWAGDVKAETGFGEHRKIRTEHVVSPGLDMNVYVTTLGARDGPVTVWVFVSRGLSERHHPELVLSVKKRTGEADANYPEQVPMFLRGVYEAAGRGRSVDVGGESNFHSSSEAFLGRTDIGGAVYTWVPPGFADLAGPNALLAIFLTREEMSIAHDYGHTRVLARLGERARHYPTPPWFDRDRPEVVGAEESSSSLIGRLNRFPIMRSSAFMTLEGTDWRLTGETGGLPDFQGSWSDGPVTLLLDPADAFRLGEVLDQIPPKSVLALMTGVPPSIARCLVWDPARLPADAAGAISDLERHQDPRCAGNFLVLCGGQDSSSVRATEDGFALLLTDADLSRVLQAIAACREAKIHDADGGVLLDIVRIQ